MSAKDFKRTALNVIDIEKKAIDEITQYINDDFDAACETIFECNGRSIVIGMGKSGHIGNKIAATLASTGTPSFFVHPGEASHGDLGMITREDVVLLISNSGETSEILNIIPVIKRIGAKTIAMTGKPNSAIAALSDIHLCVAVSKEACPLGLAPTASTTASLVMGDALAVALLEARGFTADDFALSHPGGALGKRLLLTLDDIMHKDHQVPVINTGKLIKDALFEISSKGLGMTAVVNDESKLVGIFTDGDLRRIIEQKLDLHTAKIDDAMTINCITAKSDMLAAEALNIMESKRINGLIVVDEHTHPIGALNMQDLLKAGVL